VTTHNDAAQPPSRRRGFKGLLISVLGAAIGVQKREVYEHDFKHGKPLVFIAAGLVFTILLILSLYGLVQWILP
jgi:hypothetical protein